MFTAKVADLGSPSYFVLTAAVELGFFADEGVPTSRVEGDAKGPVEVRDGTLDFFGGSAYSALQAFPNFRGAKLLCALAQNSYWFLGVRTDLDIERGDVQALRGLRISSGGGEPLVGLRQLLRDGGLDVDAGEATLVPRASGGRHQTFRGNDGVVALQQNDADAFWGNGMRMLMAEKSGIAKIHLDVRRGDGPPQARWYNFPALLVSERLIETKPKVAAGVVRAIVRTQRALRNDPSLATKVGREVFPREEADLIAELIARDAPFYNAAISQEAINGMNRLCTAAGLLRAPIPYEDIVPPESVTRVRINHDIEDAVPRT